MSQDLAERAGVPFFRSAVGEANVVDAMLANEAIFGGEGNGGPIDPHVGLVRDSFVGMALLLDAMAERELPIAAMADALPRYEIVKTKIALAKEKIPAALDCAGIAFPRRCRRPHGRAAVGLARPLAVGPRQQHRADRPRDCRGADGGGSPAALRRGGEGAEPRLICKPGEGAEADAESRSVICRIEARRGSAVQDFPDSLSLLRLDPLLAHPRPQHLGHDDRAVGLLVVLQHGDQAAADGDGGAVERVDEVACPSRP